MSAPLLFMAPGAPTPVAPFSHAVEVDGWCFVTGQICARVDLTDFETNYPRMNEVYAGYFPADRRPARTRTGVPGLARGAMVEIDLLARR